VLVCLTAESICCFHAIERKLQELVDLNAVYFQVNPDKGDDCR